MTGRSFPILWQCSREDAATLQALGCPRLVPWSLVEPHEAQALRNHGQSLEVLASRGGLSPSELLAVLNGHPLRVVLRVPDHEAVGPLLELLAAHAL